MMGISEHFEFIVPKLVKNTAGDFVDRLWSAGSSTDDYWNGIWGLFRAYEKLRNDLKPLPDNPRSQSGLPPEVIAQFDHSCPIAAPLRTYDVTAITAQQALPSGRLVYNGRTDGSFGPLFDPTAILYVRTSDLDANLKLKPGVPVEPLILRARAGECVQVDPAQQAARRQPARPRRLQHPADDHAGLQRQRHPAFEQGRPARAAALPRPQPRSTAPTSAPTQPRPWRRAAARPISGTPATSLINSNGTVTPHPSSSAPPT